MKVKAGFEEYYVKNLNEFNSIILTLDGDQNEVYYRGVNQAKFNLAPSIARNLPKDFSLQTEITFLNNFKRSSLSYYNNIYREYTGDLDSNDAETLAIAQHYGLLTRLLDWTTNPLAALWFACTPPAFISDDTDEYCAIWILVANTKFNADENKRRQFFFSEDETNMKFKDLTEIGATKIFFPNVVSPRIKNQSGLFTFHHFDARKGYVPLNENEQFFPHKFDPTRKKEDSFWDMFKIMINRSTYGKEIMRALQLYNIHDETIYPSLDNLCKRLNYQLREGRLR
ncbi:FRG domain-containing protein [Dyadobacter sp. CY261]|uniref:FRG domain-containing protein n=1 Tax=Dyadobacter sp. CY261 TaxID=2907203 RepID=UPI001F2A8D38|nr:FRG domain-containing protein [Dyadobacter sp. CY261]MCF0075243.1 FRG domain-containing protein [Dyadobacter sp. CY261]